MRKENAYMTVEAALVFPFALGSILFVVYTLLFQYDRCLLEQDLGAMAMWGSVTESSDTAALQSSIQRRMGELNREKYVVWRFTQLDASLNKNCFTVKGAGRFSFPFPGFNFWGGGNIWGAQAEYAYNRLAPVTFIRTCRKVRKAAER